MDLELDRQLAELLRRAQAGDRPAYELFLHESADLVRAFVRRRLSRPEHLEDIVQETLLSIHHYRHTYDPARPLAPWLYAIARHRLHDFLRAQQRRQHHEQTASRLAELVACEVAAEPDGLLASLAQALARLSAKQRRVIQLLKFEGHSVAEIAQSTGLSESAVKVNAHRGYKQLHQLLTRSARER